MGSAKEKLKAEYEGQGLGQKKRFKIPKYAQLDETVFEWWKEKRGLGIPINGPIIREKAIYYSKFYQMSDSNASNGWLERWKTKFNINFAKMNGESQKIDASVVDEFI